MAIETVDPIVSGPLFFVAAIMEIGGGYLVWLWIREKKTIVLALLGAIILFVYGYNTYNSASYFWKSICCIWWNIYYFFNNMGKNSRQEKARQI